MKKRMLGLLLALCMVLTLMPVSALADDIDTAEQASQTGAEGPSVQAQPKGIAIQAGETHTHCLCGETHKGSAYSDSNGVYHDNMTFETAWDKTTYLPSREGTYYLTTDVTLSNTATIDREDVTICLNGHKITSSATTKAIEVKGSTLKITDCSKNPGYISAPNARGISAVSGSLNNQSVPGKVYLYNITIKDCGDNAIHGDTSTDGSEFYLYNASILNNKGTGVYTSRGSTGQDVTIINSEISGNSESGVTITDSSHLTMINSKVENNKSYGIRIASSSSKTSTITDSTISGNVTGVYIESTPTVIGGTTKIINNTGSYNAGGINIRGASVTIKDNVEITGNTSGSNSGSYVGFGGGVYLNHKVYGTELTLAGNVKITGNKDGEGNESNLGAYYSNSKDYLMTVNSGFKGNVGIHVIGGLVPTASKPTNIASGNYVDNFSYDGSSTQYVIKYANGYTQIQTAPYAEAPTATNVTYDGNTHQAVSGGSNWVYAGGMTASPNAGNYTVSVKPDTGMTWPDGTTTEKTYNWSIRKATPEAKYFNITAPANETVYDGSAKTVTATLKPGYSGCGDITVSYKYRINDVSTWQSVEEVRNAGYYQYTVTVAGGHNFYAGSFTGNIHIGHAQQTTPVTITSGDTLAYGQSMKLTAEGGTTEYPFVWILNDANGEYISSSDIASIDNDVLTALKAGTVYIRATRPGGQSGVFNYDDISSDVKAITITAGHVTVKADDKTAYIGDTVLPINTHTVSGLAVGDVLSGQDTYTYYVMEGDVKTEVAPKDIDLTKAGEYIIEVSGLAADTTKYDSEITYVPGKLTVTSKPNNNTGSGSSSSDNGYKITLPASVSNGSVKSNVTMAEKGDTVTITATPAKGYVVDSLKVTDKNGSELELTDKGNGRYSFTMPGSKVSVEVTFKAEAQQNPEKTGFDDVSDSDWYSKAVDYAAEKGLMSGVGNNLFAPKADTTRGMLMTVLARYAGQDTTGGSVWYEKGMNWAKANGVSDGTNPTASITREQLVTMLWRYAGEPAGTASLDGFNDASTVSSYAVTAMRWAVENGIINGANGSLNPRNNASRAEVAAILMRFCEMGK